MDESLRIFSILLQFAAVLVQLTAAHFALKLIRLTGRGPAWVLLSAGFCAMAGQRSLSLILALTQAPPLSPLHFWDDVTTLLISLAMLIGVWGIAPLFGTTKQAAAVLPLDKEKLEKQVEARPEERREANPYLSLELDERRRLESPPAQSAGELSRSEADLEQFSYVTSHDLQEPLRLVASLRREVEERRAAEMAVEAERQRLFALLDGLPAIVHLKERDYSIRFANRIFREIFGDWEGKRCYELVQGRSAPCANCTSSKVFETGLAHNSEWKPHNGERIFQAYNYPFADLDGSSLVLTLGIDISQRKRIEEALKESERKYRLLVSTIPAVVFKGYADWSVDFFDNKIEAITGYGKEEFDSRRILWRDLIPPEDLGCVEAVFREALKTDRSYVREHRIRRKDGEIRWVQCRGRIFCDAKGKVEYIHGVTFDVTDRLRAEEALRQSEARLAKAQSLAHLGHWEWDLTSDQAVCSDEIYRIFGVSPDKFIPAFESVMSYVHPDDLARVRHHFAEALATTKPFSLVGRIIRPDGAVRYVHSQAEVVFDQEGKPQRMLGTAQDITERRIAEMRLRDSEARFRGIFEGSAMGIGLTDMKGRFLTANRTFLEMLGYAEAEIYGKTCLDFTHADDLAQSRELFLELTSGRRDRLQVEKRFCRQGGQYFWARVTISLVKDSEGQPLYTIGMVEDITQTRQAEKQLKESEQNLRCLASQLMTAQEDERRRISRELHDELGQSILVLKLQARCIERELRADQQALRKECLEMLENLDRVVENVRRLSRDLSPTILEDLGLSAALQHLLRDFSKHYGIELWAEKPAGIDDLFTPEAQLVIYRIFQEALTNIGKHSQAGRLTVAIKKAEDRVSFLLQDNGKGFRPSQEGRQRSGMGLAAMEERARMVGGVLAVWSQEGSGTRISFDIPFSPKLSNVALE
jgi:PAS domain S-box-containing protein